MVSLLTVGFHFSTLFHFHSYFLLLLLVPLASLFRSDAIAVHAVVVVGSLFDKFVVARPQCAYVVVHWIHNFMSYWLPLNALVRERKGSFCVSVPCISLPRMYEILSCLSKLNRKTIAFTAAVQFLETDKYTRIGVNRNQKFGVYLPSVNICNQINK